MYALRQAEWSSKAFLVQDLQTSASVSLPNRFLTILWAYHLAFFCNSFFSWKKEGHREQGDKEALQYLDDWLCQRSSVCGRGRLNLFWLIFSQKIWLIFSQKVFENCREKQTTEENCTVATGANEGGSCTLELWAAALCCFFHFAKSLHGSLH